MEIIEDKSKLYDKSEISKDVRAVASIRIDVAIDRKKAQEEFDYLKRKFTGNVIAYEERAIENSAKKQKKKIASAPEYMKCPFTGKELVERIDSQEAIEKGYITKHERRQMKSAKDVVRDPLKFLAYNTEHCTLETKKGLVTIVL